MHRLSASDNSAEQYTPRPLFHALLLFVLLLLVSEVAGLRTWSPLPLLLPITLSSLIVLLVPALRYRPDWLRFGRVHRKPLALSAATLLLSPALILIWVRLTAPNLSALSHQIPAGSLALVIAAGVVFALVNAVCEEVICRGILQQALNARMGAQAGWIAQGLVFGVLHTGGVPQGAYGVGLACVFGMSLGWIRRESEGIGLCCIVHFGTDLAIFALLAATRNG